MALNSQHTTKGSGNGRERREKREIVKREANKARRDEDKKAVKGE